MARRLIALSLALVVPIGAFGLARSSTEPRAATPEDRYAMAGGCYGIRSAATGDFVVRQGEGFAATATSLGDAEPFLFQATDLGSYLLYGAAQDFLAASEGLVGEAGGSATGSTAGGIVGGLSGERTDGAADAAASGPAGTATGRGAAVVSADSAGELADWEIMQAGPDVFTLRLPATEQTLVAGPGGGLALEIEIPAGDGARFGFQVTNGCASFPEVEVNVTGDPAAGDTPFEEVRGFLDAHVHAMAFEFIGGRSRCGRPWHRYGVAHALVDCPDHEPGGRGAVLEAVLGGGSPLSHDTTGWPKFGYWPKNNSLTHEQVYYKWLERAWRGGLRMMTNLLVDNHALCSVYPYRRNSCNEMDGVRLQAQRIHELERYIDAQNGGPGEGWFRIVADPFQARRVINAGKLAVVLGIEVSIPLDCGVVLDKPQCDETQIDERLEGVFELGVRQMELVNKFDNALSGVTGDTDATGVVVNNGNALETGRFWQLTTCDEDDKGTDKHQLNVHDQTGGQNPLTARDSIIGGVLLQETGASGVAPLYPPGPHCNVRGLTPLGAHAIEKMMALGMLFDPDHMSARARHAGLDILEAAGYSGAVSSHSWADDEVYRRVYRLGGVVTPHAGSSTSFAATWQAQTGWFDSRFYRGFGFGSDVNGFSVQGAPRFPAVKVTYPFTGFGGVTIDKQRSGQRVYNINTDGVAHYGLYPDWIEDLRLLAGDGIVEDLSRGPEAYLQMWERATDIKPNACRADVPDLTNDDVSLIQTGMTWDEVLDAVGQPDARVDSTFRYCATGGTVTVLFDAAGTVSGVI